MKFNPFTYFFNLSTFSLFHNKGSTSRILETSDVTIEIQKITWMLLWRVQECPIWFLPRAHTSNKAGLKLVNRVQSEKQRENFLECRLFCDHRKLLLRNKFKLWTMDSLVIKIFLSKITWNERLRGKVLWWNRKKMQLKREAQ